MSGFCRPHPQQSWRKESLWWTPEQACIRSAGKTCCRLRRVDAHDQQKGFEFRWNGNRKHLKKSDDGGNSQRRGANKRRGNSVCQRIGVILYSNASRGYTCSSVTRKTLRRSWEKLPLDQWSETTSHQKWLEDQLQLSEVRTLRCSWSIDKFLNFIFTYFSYIFIAGHRDSHGASSNNKKW